jgi:hypothetical protein
MRQIKTAAKSFEIRTGHFQCKKGRFSLSLSPPPKGLDLPKKLWKDVETSK